MDRAQHGQNLLPMVFAFCAGGVHVELSAVNRRACHSGLDVDAIEVFCREVTVVPPVTHGAKHVFEEAWERSPALSPIEAFIAGVAFVLVAPIGRGGELLEETGLGAGEAAGTLEGCGSLTGAMAGGD